MRLPRPDRIPLAVPGPALAGVAVLVALVVLTTTYDTDRSPVVLPRAPTMSAVAELGAACVVVQRDVDLGGRESVRWRFSDGREMSRPIEPESLFFEASRVADRAPDRTFVVKADADLRWAVVDDVIETLRNAGARDVVLWTGRREEGRDDR